MRGSDLLKVGMIERINAEHRRLAQETLVAAEKDVEQIVRFRLYQISCEPSTHIRRSSSSATDKSVGEIQSRHPDDPQNRNVRRRVHSATHAPSLTRAETRSTPK